MIILPFEILIDPYEKDYLNIYYDKIKNNVKYDYSEYNFINEYFQFKYISKATISNKKILIHIDQGIDCLLLEKNDFSFIKNYEKYIPKESDTFKNKTNDKNVDRTYKLNYWLISEKIKFLNSISKDNITDINLDFLMNKILLENNFDSYLRLGLKLLIVNQKCPNLIKQLKNNEVINNYKVTYFFNQDRGEIVIGDYPHVFFPNKYKKYQFISFYGDLRVDSYEFIINFNKIYFNMYNTTIYMSNYLRMLIYFNYGYIIGTKEYQKQIEALFFNELYNKGICFKKETNRNTIENYEMIICNKEMNIFPELYFFLNYQGNNITFQFNYQDLFLNKDNRYYFLIIFEKYSTETWKFGKVFLQKYTMVFDGDKKTIGYYDSSIKLSKKEDEKEDDSVIDKNDLKIKDNFEIIFMVVMILILIIISIVCFYLKKIYDFISKKRKANEMNDGYEYVQHQYSLFF